MNSTFCFLENGIRPRAASGMGLNLASEGQDKPLGSVPEQENEKSEFPGAPRILIAEDMLLAAWHLESLVHDLNFQLCGLAADGKEAVERANALIPNLLLVDINLGKGIDGIESARRIRETIDTAVVFVTAYNDAASLARIRQAFPTAPVLTKPVTLGALRIAIAAVSKI